MAPVQDALPAALKSRSMVQSHMKQHQTTWGPSPPPSDTDKAIQVFVRARPLLKEELEKKAYSLVMVQPERTVHFTHPTTRWSGGRFATKTFDADGAFAESATNDEVYERTDIRSSLESCLIKGGQELYVLAYGQTGTGKTYTTASIEERLTRDLADLIPESDPPSITASIFEIRGNSGYDLLSDPPHAPVKIQTSLGDSATYPGLSVQSVQTPSDLAQLIAKAKELRLTRSTVKNDTSSRSHCVVNIRFNHLRTGDSSNIYIVDLAGSERSSYATKNSAERMKESIEINKSLAALKDCIRARLAPQTAHIPWRGSKLTMVLRGAFEISERELKTSDEGCHPSSRLVILACISPSVIDSEDTLNTLKYITPFQLTGRDLVDAAVLSKGGTLTPNTINEWSHAESVEYIKRHLLKLAPVVTRLLPDPTSTIVSLLPLSVAELTNLACTPGPNESPTAPLVDPRTLAQIRIWVEVYHRKLADVAKRSKDEETLLVGGTVRRAGATTQAALMSALNGVNPESNETGFVTRYDAKGQLVHIRAGQGADRI